MVADARSLLWSGLAVNTRNTYSTGTRSYLNFISRFPFALDSPLPATDTAVCMWLTHLHRSGLKFTSIRVYMFGLKSHHTDLDIQCSFPHSQLVARLYRGIKRVQGSAENVTPRFAVTFDVLRELDRRVLLTRAYAHDSFSRLLRAVMWVAAAGLFRVGEVVVDRANAQANAIDRLVCVRDLRVLQLKPLVVAIHLRASKTDVFRHEVDVKVCNSTAVQALFTYLQHRPTPITPDSPLFATDDGRPLTRKHLLSSVTALFAMAQIDTSGHAGVSFRRGGATSLAAAGVPDHLVKLLGRWLGWSYTRYIETSIQTLVDITGSL